MVFDVENDIRDVLAVEYLRCIFFFFILILSSDTLLILPPPPPAPARSIADRELSRHHSRLECQEGSMYISGGSSVTGASDDDGEERLSKRHVEYFLCDVGSTNGTFVQVR